MAIDPDLLKILVCPEDKTPLSVAGEDLVRDLNARISSGSLKNRAGKAVTEKIDGGLVRQDGKFIYPIRGDIPIMLIDEAIQL